MGPYSEETLATVPEVPQRSERHLIQHEWNQTCRRRQLWLGKGRIGVEASGERASERVHPRDWRRG